MAVSNLLSRLLSGVSNVAGHAEDSIMPSPAAGLFSPDDLAAARKQGMLHLGLSLLGDTSGRGLGSALQQGVGEAQGAYGNALQSSMQQGTLAKQQAILKQREEIGKKYAPKPGESIKDVFARYPQMYIDYMRVGDLEAAKNVEGIVQQQVGQQDVNKLQAVQAGDRIYTFDPKTGVYVPGPERRMTQDEKDEKAMDRAMKQQQIGLLQQQREAMAGEQARNNFLRQNKALIDTEPLFQNWEAAYRDAKAGNPAAYKSAIMNFAAIADPKLQIRLGTLNFASKVDPSLMGQAQIALQRSKDGTFPDQILEQMNKHVHEMHRGTLKVYDAKRAERVKSNRALEQFIPSSDDIFPSKASLDAPIASSPVGGESRIQQFLKGFGH